MSQSLSADAYCRVCRASFERPLPQPYGAFCPDCFAVGNIVTLTDVPGAGRASSTGMASSRRADREAVGRRVGQGALAAAVRELRSQRGGRRSIGPAA